MPRKRPPEPDGDDLLTLLAEQEHGPLPCPHAFSVGAGKKDGWTHETDPNSAYYLQYVHSDQSCRRSMLTPQVPLDPMGWDPDLQKDVPM